MRGIEKIRHVFKELDELNRCLHQQEDGSVGGALHIVVDHGNLQDHHVLSCARDLVDDGAWSVVTRLVSREMVRLLLLLEPAQRLVWYYAYNLTEMGEDPEAWAARLVDCALKDSDGCWKAVVTRVGVVEFPGMEEMSRRYEAQRVVNDRSSRR